MPAPTAKLPLTAGSIALTLFLLTAYPAHTEPVDTDQAMRRRLLLTLLAALFAAPAALAAPGLGPNDGTLSVRNGDGAVALNMRGAAIGRVGSGTLEVETPVSGSCEDLDVWGPESMRERAFEVTKDGLDVQVCRFAGRNIRFRLIGGRQVVRIKGASDVDLSAVGIGYFFLDGADTRPNGTFSQNGGPYRPLPQERTRFGLVAED